MFRRQEDTLEPDARYPADLEQLGYFIDNSRHGCIRNIGAPDLFFDFHHTNNERHNEVRGDAMRTCQCREVLKRLSALGIKELYMPGLTTTKPKGPHVPILAPAAEVLKTRKRIIVIINDDRHQDLGILAYRELQRERGVNGGSIVNFVKDIVARTETDHDGLEELFQDGTGVKSMDQIPGVVVLNTAQLLYSHKFNRALSARSWAALPRKSIAHDIVRVHPVENNVEGHRTSQEHIKSVFDSVIQNSDFVAPNAEVYVIAIENGVDSLLDVLNEDFWAYGSRITAMAAIHTERLNAQITHPALKAFLHMRARHWKACESTLIDPTVCISLPSDYKSHGAVLTPESSQLVEWLKPSAPREQTFSPEESARKLYTNSTYYMNPLTVDKRDEPVKLSGDSFILETDPFCPTFPGGDTWVSECIFTQRVVQTTIMTFFEDVARDPYKYTNPPFNLHAPEPTPDRPLTLSSEDAGESANFNPLPQEMLTLEQQSLVAARKLVADMKTALLVTPSTSEFEGSRLHLQKRIEKKEKELRELEKETLATGGLGAGAVPELRQEMENKAIGEQSAPKKEEETVLFAGRQADSEIAKGAQNSETVEEELARLGIR